MRKTAYSKKDFAWTQWQAEDIQKAVSAALLLAEQKHKEIKSIEPAERTFGNTVVAIEHAHTVSMELAYKLYLLMSVSPDAGVRQTAQKEFDALSKKLLDLNYDEDIFRAFQEYAFKKEKLNGPDQKLREDMARDFKRMGFGLSPLVRKKLKNNLKKLQKLEVDFQNNINAWQDYIVVSREELEGLPERYVAQLEQEKDGLYRVTLRYPDMIPFMENAVSTPKRSELRIKNLQKGGKQNLKLLKQILDLRHAKAKLLGYKNHPEYVLEIQMARDPKTVADFLDTVVRAVMPSARKDITRLRDLKRTHLQDKKANLEGYDVAFYSERLSQQEFGFSTETVREYFPLAHVKKTILETYQHLLGLRFKKLSGYPVWHEDVECYQANNQNGELVGYFMMDLYPRDNKYGHAAAFDLIKNSKISGDSYQAPLTALVTNFPKPSPGQASLLTHDEVRTFFHEFGHVMHELCTVSDYASQSGFAVPRDFVEVASKMFEYWIWDADVLRSLSHHYKTGKQLPEEILQALIRSKQFQISYTMLSQAIYSLFDLTLHLRPALDPRKLYRDLNKKYTGITIPVQSYFPAGFGHLMGYDAGYYGYLWAFAIAADLATRFKKEGFSNAKLGYTYRQSILAPGASREVLDSVTEFLGKKPDNKAFLAEVTTG